MQRGPILYVKPDSELLGFKKGVIFLGPPCMRSGAQTSQYNKLVITSTCDVRLKRESYQRTPRTILRRIDLIFCSSDLLLFRHMEIQTSGKHFFAQIWATKLRFLPVPSLRDVASESRCQQIIPHKIVRTLSIQFTYLVPSVAYLYSAGGE